MKKLKIHISSSATSISKASNEMQNTQPRNNLFLRIPTQYPKTILALFVIAGIALAWSALKFEINASAETLLTEDNPLYLKTQIADRKFNPQEFLLIVYEPKSHSLFSEQTYRDLQTLTQKLQIIDRVESVQSLLNVPLLSLANGSLNSDIDPDEWTLENIKVSPEKLSSLFSGHPIYENLLINEKQTATAIQLSFKRNLDLEEINGKIIDIWENAQDRTLSSSERESIKLLKEAAKPIEKKLGSQRNREIEEIRQILEEYKQNANYYVGGNHALAYQLITIIKNDLVVFGSAIAAMICLVLVSLFKRLKWVLIPMICCIFCVISTMGIFALFGLEATVISSNFIALQLILTLAIVIHLIVQYREELKNEPESRIDELVSATLKEKAMPCFYAALTTSVGFASLLFTDIQPVKSFGFMMIIAMFISTISSLLLFPALMGTFKHDKTAKPESSVANKIISKLSGYSISRKKTIITLTFSVVVISGIGILTLDAENSFINYFKKSTVVYKELFFIDRQFGGSTPLDIVYTIPKSETKDSIVLSAKSVQTLQAMQNEVQPLKGIGKMLSVVNFTQLGKSINQDRPLTEYELTSLYFSLDESLRESLFGSYFSKKDNQARISIRVQDSTDDLNRANLLATIHSKMQGLGLSEEQYSLSNLFVLYQDILKRLLKSQVLSIVLVFAALLASFLAIFRSIKLAFIAITPNIVSTILILGFMGWTHTPLDLMTITIAAVAMGIAVDDTIHYIYRYRQEIMNADNTPLAIERTHSSVGYAILYTSIVIILGFSLLGFSDFVPSIQFGLLTALSILIALLADLCLLPVLLGRFLPVESRN